MLLYQYSRFQRQLGLLRHAKLPHHLGHGFSKGSLNLGLPELADDLLRRMLLPSWHLLPSLGLHHPENLSERGDVYVGAGQARTPVTNLSA